MRELKKGQIVYGVRKAVGTKVVYSIYNLEVLGDHTLQRDFTVLIKTNRLGLVEWWQDDKLFATYEEAYEEISQSIQSRIEGFMENLILLRKGL